MYAIEWRPAGAREWGEGPELGPDATLLEIARQLRALARAGYYAQVRRYAPGPACGEILLAARPGDDRIVAGRRARIAARVDRLDWL